MQTLTTLDLSSNQIGDQGAQYFAEVLHKNSVSQNQSLHFYHIHHSYFIQALIKLDLRNNGIGDTGAQYIVEGLEKNSVRQNQSFHLSYASFLFYTDTQRTLPPGRSNRSSRCTISW